MLKRRINLITPRGQGEWQPGSRAKQRPLARVCRAALPARPTAVTALRPRASACVGGETKVPPLKAGLPTARQRRRPAVLGWLVRKVRLRPPTPLSLAAEGKRRDSSQGFGPTAWQPPAHAQIRAAVPDAGRVACLLCAAAWVVGRRWCRPLRSITRIRTAAPRQLAATRPWQLIDTQAAPQSIALLLSSYAPFAAAGDSLAARLLLHPLTTPGAVSAAGAAPIKQCYCRRKVVYVRCTLLKRP